MYNMFVHSFVMKKSSEETNSLRTREEFVFPEKHLVAKIAAQAENPSDRHNLDCPSDHQA